VADTLVFDELTGLPPAPALEDVDLGKRPTLEEARLSKLFSAYELAKRSGVAHTTIIDIEQKNAKPRLSTIRKLADALGVDPRDIAWPGNPLRQPDPDPDDSG
jgi:transcriptional regulator with XRE-family HTH domain